MFDAALSSKGIKSASTKVVFAGTDGTTQTFQGTDTILGRGTTDTITGVKTFNDATLKLNGATSGASTLKAPAIASTYVHTLPARTGTIADDTDLALKAPLASPVFTGDVGIGGTPSNVANYTKLLLKGLSSGAGGILDLQTSDASTFARLISNVTAFYIETQTNHPQIFITNNVARMEIKADGVVDLLMGQLKFPATC